MTSSTSGATLVRVGEALRAPLPGTSLSAVRRELPALIAFRWRFAARRPRAALAVVLLVVAGVGLGLPLGLGAVLATSEDRLTTFLILLPTAWAFFALSAVVGAVGAAGGRELLPRAQAVAFPVSPVTDHAGALLTTPLNLAWTLQVVTLTTAAGALAVFDVLTGVTLFAVTLGWVVTVTCIAQLVGWLAELCRTYPRGEWVLRALTVAAVLALVAVVWTGRLDELADDVPTRDLVLAGSGGDVPSVLIALVIMVAVTTGATMASVPVVALLARRRTPDVAALETRDRPRFGAGASAAAVAVRLDRRMVLRAAPLRRGLAVLTILPLVAAALVGVPWVGVAVLPAVVVSAAGLLYGVNAFVLDGPGAVWRDSLPQDPNAWLSARLGVLAELCALTAGAVVLTAATRSGAPPTAAEATAVGCALAVAVSQVVTRCARWSVRRPFAAALRSARDAPAPPVALARYSVTLAFATTAAGIAFALAAQLGSVLLPVLMTVPFGLLAARSLRRSAAEFADATRRSRVTATVAGG